MLGLGLGLWKKKIGGIILTLEQQVAAMLPDLWLDATETYAKSKIACDFDNAVDSDYLSVTDSVFDFGKTDTFSGSCWVYRTSANNEYILGQTTTAGNGWALRHLNGKIRFHLAATIASVEIRLDTPTAVLTLNNWHHVAFSYDGTSLASGCRLYVDGVRSTVTDTDTLSTSDFLQTGLPFYVGRGGGTADFFDGYIDQAVIFDSVLTDGSVAQGVTATGEVAELYASNAGLNYKDLDGTETFYANIVAWYDMNVPINFGRNYASDKHAINLTGTQRLTKTGQPFLFDYDDSWSCAMWVKFTAIGTNGQLINEAKATNIGWSFLTTGGKLAFWLAGSAGASDRMRVEGSTALSTGVWTHIGMTYDGTNDYTGVKFYINGVDDTAVELASRAGTSLLTDGSVPFNIGYGGIGAMNGVVDQAAVYNTVLTEANMLTLTNSGVPLLYADTIQTNLVGFWDLQIQALDATVVDSVGTNDLTPFSLAQADLVGGVGSLDLLETGINSSNAELGHVSGNASGYDGVTEWTNRGATGNVSQATVTLVPSWLENSINTTEDSVLFDGTDDYMTSASNLLPLSDMVSPFTVCALIKANKNQVQYIFYNNQLRIGQLNSRGYFFEVYGTNGYIIQNTTNLTESQGAYVMISFIYDGTYATTAEASITTWDHLTEVTTGRSNAGHSGTIATYSGTNEVLGRSGSGDFDGEVAQVLAIPSALSLADLTTVRDYWNEKYDLGL